MSRLWACWATQAPVGWAVIPARCTRRVRARSRRVGRRRRKTVSTWAKSTARIAWAWAARNCRHVGPDRSGLIRCRRCSRRWRSWVGKPTQRAEQRAVGPRQRGAWGGVGAARRPRDAAPGSRHPPLRRIGSSASQLNTRASIRRVEEPQQ
jgi:hypothetical protein